MRLIVEDAKGKRGFKVGAGALTLGSGEGAQLRLEGQGVAEVHAELEITESGGVLRPLAGVPEPEVDGAPIQSETTLAIGQTIVLGAARVTLADESGEQKPAPVVRSRKGSTVGGRSRTRAGARGRGRKKSSTGTLAAVAVGVAGILAFAGWRVFSAGPAGDPNLLLATAENMIQNRERGRVDAVLASLPPREQLTPAQRARLDKVQDDLTNQFSEVSEGAENIEGFRFFDEKLLRFRDKHLAEGDVDAGKVRYYLELCAEFEARWPTHPELEKVEAERERLAPYGSLDDTPTWEQLETCVNHWTGGSPKRYRDAFRLLDVFLANCDEEARPAANKLRSTLVEERSAYYDEKKTAAQTALEDDKIGTCVYWLVELTVNIGDDEMSDRAARALLKIPNLEGYLVSLRRDDRHRYALLMDNRTLRDFAESKGV